VQEIRVESVIVPEVVLVVFAFPVTFDHEIEEPCHSEADVGPHQWSQSVEGRVDGSENLVLGVSCDRAVR